MSFFTFEWLITIIPVSIVIIIGIICLVCFCTRACRCKQTNTQTVPQNTDGPIHDPGIYNESFTPNQAVFTIPGSAFMPYSTGLPINYVISTTQVVTITSETDDEAEEAEDVNASTIERTRRSEGRRYDDGVTLAVNTLPSGPPRYGSLYFCPPPDYEEALEIADLDEEQVTHYV